MQILDRIGIDMGIKQSVADGLRLAFTVNHAAPNGLFYQLHVYRVNAATKVVTGRLTALREGQAAARWCAWGGVPGVPGMRSMVVNDHPNHLAHQY